MIFEREVKIGKRLKQLQSLVTEPYDHIWDCCCDHGLLGAALLRQHPESHIHFVDVVPALIDALNERLSQHFADRTHRWQTLCMDAGALPLNDYPGKHLVVIAGVGGDLMMDMVARLQDANPEKELDFLLCPVHHQYALRTLLISRGFKLKEEVLVEENRRFYEIMLVTTHQNTHQPYADISPVGSRLWLTVDQVQPDNRKRYLTQTLAHYERIQRGKPDDVQPILHAYQQVNLS